jgi:hypothetical protein
MNKITFMASKNNKPMERMASACIQNIFLCPSLDFPFNSSSFATVYKIVVIEALCFLVLESNLEIWFWFI